MLISVIIPVYNAAAFLRRCVDSLLAQTFRNFEIILVDDGSTDSSANICDEYVKKGVRGNHETEITGTIRVVHQANAGVSTARNRGIAEAQGEYISFVDADDWVEPDFLQTFADEVEKHKGVDLVVQGFIDQNGTVRTWPQSHYSTKRELGSDLYELEKNSLIRYVWNKLFRRELIVTNLLQFNSSIIVGEDYMFVLLFISNSQHVIIQPYAGYHYIYPSDSNKSYPLNAWMKRLTAFKSLLSSLSFISEETRLLFKAKEFKDGLYVLRIVYHDRLPRKERLAYLSSLKKDAQANPMLHIGNYELPFWVLAVLVLYTPNVVCDAIMVIVQKVRTLFRQ